MGASKLFIDSSGCTTQQSAKDECDLNIIVEKARRGADVSHLTRTAPMYGDFTNLPDYREAMVMVTKANEMFMTLDPFVRERFANDPARLLDFLADDKNYSEAVKLGLVERKKDDPDFVDPVPSTPKVVKAEAKAKAKPAADAEV